MRRRKFLALASAAVVARQITRRIDGKLDEASAHSLNFTLSPQQKSVLAYSLKAFDTVCLGDTNHGTGLFEYLLFSPEFAQLAGQTPVFAEMNPAFQKYITQLQKSEISPGEFNTYCNKHGLNMWIGKGMEEKICFAMTDGISHAHLNLYAVDNRDNTTLPLRLTVMLKITNLAINEPAQFVLPRSWPSVYGYFPAIAADSLISYAVNGDALLSLTQQDANSLGNIKEHIKNSSQPIIIAYGAGHFLASQKEQSQPDIMNGLAQMGRHPVTINIYCSEHDYSDYLKHANEKILGVTTKMPDIGIILATHPSETGRVIFFNDEIGQNYLASIAHERLFNPSKAAENKL